MKPDKKGKPLQPLYRLVEVMKSLRAEGGCPWDREQNHETLKPYLIEEVYEVLDAIDSRNDEALKEELGDLLLQIVFHAQIATEEGRFTIDDVAREIVKKLIRRHPHVFGQISVDGTEEVLSNWEKIKKEEGKDTLFAGVPRVLPALLKARRVQEKAKRVGFDWSTKEGALEKVNEEIAELHDAITSKNPQKIEEEFGDLLFSLVNVSRFLEIDAEDALRKTVNKFIKRFQFIEKKVKMNGSRPIEEYTLEELDRYWDESKHA